jgi:hypothetical protein
VEGVGFRGPTSMDAGALSAVDGVGRASASSVVAPLLHLGRGGAHPAGTGHEWRAGPTAGEGQIAPQIPLQLLQRR